MPTLRPLVQGGVMPHESTHVSGGSDAFLSTDLLEAIVQRLSESGGPTTLKLGTSGYPVFGAGTLDLTAAPADAISASGTAGGSASGATAGTAAAGSTADELGVGGQGTSGATGGTGAGAQAAAPTNQTPANG